MQKTERDKRFAGMMRSPLLPWFAKKQLAVAMETTFRFTGTEESHDRDRA
jgi:hypothetical protein